MTEILVFNSAYVETAHTLAIRTGLSIHKGDWKPERGGAYIVYGADKQVDALMKVKKELGCIFIIMNFLSISEIKGTPYEEVLRGNICLEQNIDAVQEFTDNLKVPSQFIVHESFQNKNEGERPIDFIYYEANPGKQHLELKDLFIDPKIKDFELKKGVEYSIEQLSSFFIKAKTYISWNKNDWLNINKALSCGCRVISCIESDGMMELYQPFVTFQEELDIAVVVLQPDYEQFQKTVISYSLNKYLYIIQQIYGKVKKENTVISSGESQTSGATIVGEQTETANE